MPSISVIIPTLNEASSLCALLTSLIQQKSIDLELIVSDGGSSDATLEELDDFDVKVINAPRGRGAQMNAAVEYASSDWLLFLHSDSRIEDRSLVSNALSYIKSEHASCGEELVGHFSIIFDRKDSKKRLSYFYYEQKSKLNRPQTFNGDQGLLISKKHFLKLGGFSEELPFLEDQDIGVKISRVSRFITLPGVLYTSARRFEREGFARRMILNAIVMALYHIGFKEFFAQAKAVYCAQDKSSYLRLSPFFSLINGLFISLGWGYFEQWYLVGRYVRRNAWQIAFYYDVHLLFYFNKETGFFLSMYDRYFDKILQFKFFNAIAALLTFSWFHVSWVYFYLRDCLSKKPAQVDA